MKIFVFIFSIFLSGAACAEIVIELSGKKLPIFNAPFLKDHASFYLVERDPVNRIDYIAHTSCSTFSIVGLTENEAILKSETDIANLIETAHDYADIFCPQATKAIFTVANSLDMADRNILFRTAIERDGGKWKEETDKRENFLALREKERRDGITALLDDKTFTQRLAYMLGKGDLNDLPKLTLDTFINGGTADTTAMVLISRIDETAGTAAASYPVSATVKGLPDKVGYYIIQGKLTARGISAADITVSRYIECSKKGCSEFADNAKVMEVLLP